LVWEGWLQTHSGKRGKPPAMGGAGHTVLDDAPGSYVLKEPIL
jgi:polyhydroxyalkanoate synthase